MKRLWLDLGTFQSFRSTNPTDHWQDHGLGLLRTIMRNAGLESDICSTRALASPQELANRMAGYDLLLMNVRSYNWPMAKMAAQLFKQANGERGIVVAGGMHATVSPEQICAFPFVDHVCTGNGEKTILELARNPSEHPRLVRSEGFASMADWPMIDRSLWPDPGIRNHPHPLEPAVPGWGPPPVATLLTSRVCPWRCAFCNEASYIANQHRRPVDSVIDELNWLDEHHGPLGSVVFHDSMFFQQPRWLEEWLEKYPSRARRLWPYWAAARADTIRRWPDLYRELLIRTNWHTVSIGLESGSDRVLRILNKECTAADNLYAIILTNNIGDQLESQGRMPAQIYANIILGTPGEDREDVFDTLRMMSCIKRPHFSTATYAPYPGSVLGYQITAEGKSLIADNQHDRAPDNRFVKGIDYDFLDEVQAGKYTAEAVRGRGKYVERLLGAEQKLLPLTEPRPASHVYLFNHASGKKKAAFGTSPEDALANLATRLTPAEMRHLRPTEFTRTTQMTLQDFKSDLG